MRKVIMVEVIISSQYVFNQIQSSSFNEQEFKITIRSLLAIKSDDIITGIN